MQRVDPLSERERREFERTRTLLDKPDKPVRIDVASIDPTTFNIVDHYLKFPMLSSSARGRFRATCVAKSIFDFCAAQSCHLPGPLGDLALHPVPVRARRLLRVEHTRCARSSRTSTGTAARRCSASPTRGMDRLAVRADKWGGCCVDWWYHVAPLVRVRLRLRLRFGSFQFYDRAGARDGHHPGMFDKPVLLSTWLMAQENTGCLPNANLSMYSVQPGSAYAPASYAGTAFVTDPAYSDTHTTLINYKNFTTCP